MKKSNTVREIFNFIMEKCFVFNMKCEPATMSDS